MTLQNTNPRGFFGVIIPIEILDSDLTPAEKIIYAYIASYSKCCMDSNERISERINVSKETVSRAINKLQKMNYLFVEFVKNNPSKRRIYAIFDNPKKIGYLTKKGYFSTGFSTSEESKKQGSSDEPSQNDEAQPSECAEPSQNDEVPSQNVKAHNGGEPSQNVNQRIKNKKKKEITEQKTNYESPAGSAGKLPASRLKRPLRKDFENDVEFEEAFYAWNTALMAPISS